MIRHAFRRSLPWFAFVNVSFALMVLMRSKLFDTIPQTPMERETLLSWIDLSMSLIITASLGLLSLIFLLRKPVRLLAKVFLLAISVLWSVTAYYFVAHWQLPFGWPLICVLMLSGLAALYFHLSSLLCYLMPMWLSMPVISFELNLGLIPQFIVLWLILTVILVYGRINLNRWFSDAWHRFELNQLLIGRLDLMASQDALTEIANRRTLESYLSQLCSQGAAFSLIMLDVDYFKRFNDAYGHQAGDDCLTRVARVLKSAVRSPEDLVARYGGEEFTLVLTNATTKEAIMVAERIRQQLEQAAIAHSASDISCWVTVSMGIAETRGGLAPEQVITLADEALYRAKHQGRNRWAH
ncbi:MULTISPECIES: membrane-associated sensor domain-containing protein [unclassified Pantoea]